MKPGFPIWAIGRLAQLAMASDLCAGVFEGLTSAGWDRELVYNWPSTEVRDVRWVGRYTYDIERLLARSQRTG